MMKMTLSGTMNTNIIYKNYLKNQKFRKMVIKIEGNFKMEKKLEWWISKTMNFKIII
jgi:hypothetical protein